MGKNWNGLPDFDNLKPVLFDVIIHNGLNVLIDLIAFADRAGVTRGSKMSDGCLQSDIIHIVLNYRSVPTFAVPHLTDPIYDNYYSLKLDVLKILVSTNVRYPNVFI